MIWVSFFAVNIAQGLFLLSLLPIKGVRNPLAARLLAAMVIAMILTNLAYFVIRTELIHCVPQLFAVSWATAFIFGPLFYLYARSVIDHTFHWKKMHWLHFMPYLITLVMNIPMLTASMAFWAGYFDTYFAGNMPVRTIQKVFLPLQSLHMLIYLCFTIQWLQTVKAGKSTAQYMVPLAARVKWLRSLIGCFILFFSIGLALFLFILFQGKFNPVTNYLNTIASSAIIYFIAYSLVLNPELVNPDFAKKYRTAKTFKEEDSAAYLARLNQLMNEAKIFTNPDLKLLTLAGEIGLPAHQTSKLINETFEKNFQDFINGYRVQEFIRRINQPQYRSFSIYGLALEVGFNSKSSFNIAFKKATGKNPSDYRTEA